MSDVLAHVLTYSCRNCVRFKESSPGVRCWAYIRFCKARQPLASTPAMFKAK